METEDFTRLDIRHYLWRRGDLSWKLHATQKKIHEVVASSSSDEVLVFSSRQLGKSYWAAIYALEYCIKHPNSIVRILAATLKQIQDIVNDNINPICQDAPHGLIERQKSSYRWQVGSSSLRIGPLERAYVDYNRGGNAALVICEEGGFVKSEDYDYAVKSVIGPQLLRSGGKLIHVTTPSKDPLHVIHTETLPKAALHDALFRYTIYDNPQISTEQIEKAKELCGGAHTEAWRREYLAEVVRDPASTIVPTFDESRHVRDFKTPSTARYYMAIDWGGVRDKTVGLIYGYDFQRDRVLFLDEFVVEPNTPTEAIVRVARDKAAILPDPLLGVWADCPGQLQIDLHQSHGFEVRLPIKDDWQAGINNMQLAFARGFVEIHPRCKFLIQSLHSGQYNKHRTDFERSAVLGHCDALAAAMYALRMVDKTMPSDLPNYPKNRYLQVNKPPKDEEIVASAIVPKSFISDRKRFGSFKGN